MKKIKKFKDEKIMIIKNMKKSLNEIYNEVDIDKIFKSPDIEIIEIHGYDDSLCIYKEDREALI